MHYLIDGHNLIARLPDISLSDADDEAQLTAKLKRWTAASRKRKVTVVFDTGLPGGTSHWSSGVVKVVFASGNSSADALLIRRLKGVRNPPEYTLVSSDQAIINVAIRRQVAVIRSAEFADKLTAEIATRAAPKKKETGDDTRLSPSEVDEWLAIFGGNDDTGS